MKGNNAKINKRFKDRLKAAFRRYKSKFSKYGTGRLVRTRCECGEWMILLGNPEEEVIATCLNKDHIMDWTDIKCRYHEYVYKNPREEWLLGNQTFSIENPKKVNRFLKKHPAVLPFLKEAGKIIQEYFPKYWIDEVSLDFLVDSETNEEYDFLVICIQTNFSIEIFKESSDFHEWWSSVPQKIKRVLGIRIELDWGDEAKKYYSLF
jgi:hypothetical protein